VSQKEAKDLIAEYERHGFRVEKTRHWKVYSPEGHLVTVFSGSQCGGRGSQNAKAALRRLVRQHQAVAA
jgi:hypothetical protein